MNNNEPVILGKIKKSGKNNPLAIIILFLFIGAFLFFLPTIISYFGDNNIVELARDGKLIDFFINHDLYVNKNIEPEENTKEQNKEKTYINSKTIINEYGIKINNFNLTNDSISFKTNSEVNLDSTYYYLLLKKDGKNLYAIRLLSGETTFTFKEKLSSLIQIEGVIKRYNDMDYPEVNLSSDESGLSSITCSIKNEQYEYLFDNNRLTKVNETLTYLDTGDNNKYLEEFTKYSKLSREINNNNGISSLEENETGFIFKAEVDLSTYLKEINNYYSYNTKSNKVKFDMEAKGFDCK